LSQYIPVLFMLAVAGAISVGMVLASELLGPKFKFREKMEPFECGEVQASSSKQRFSIRFYLVAMMFIIFDIEAVFLFPWAVTFQALGVFGFIEMMIFILILAAGLIYIWKKGVLDWE